MQKCQEFFPVRGGEGIVQMLQQNRSESKKSKQNKNKESLAFRFVNGGLALEMMGLTKYIQENLQGRGVESKGGWEGRMHTRFRPQENT